MESEETKKNEEVKNVKDSDFKISHLLIIFGCIFIIWALSYVILVFFIQPRAERGAFGDAFGSINALFSGFAFGGIIYTIWLQNKVLKLQKEDLNLQKKDLELTRNELIRTADAQEESKEALNKQIESMKITAKLNALNSLVETYTRLELSLTLHIARVEAERKKDIYIKEIENILEQLGK